MFSSGQSTSPNRSITARKPFLQRRRVMPVAASSSIVISIAAYDDEVLIFTVASADENGSDMSESNRTLN